MLFSSFIKLFTAVCDTKPGELEIEDSKKKLIEIYKLFKTT